MRFADDDLFLGADGKLHKSYPQIGKYIDFQLYCNKTNANPHGCENEVANDAPETER